MECRMNLGCIWQQESGVMNFWRRVSPYLTSGVRSRIELILANSCRTTKTWQELAQNHRRNHPILELLIPSKSEN